MIRVIISVMAVILLGACATAPPKESVQIPAPLPDVEITNAVQFKDIEGLNEKIQDRKTANFELLYARGQIYLSAIQRREIAKHLTDAKIAILQIGAGPYPKVWESRASSLEQYLLDNRISVARVPFDETLRRRSAHVWLIDSIDEEKWRPQLDYHLVEPPEYYVRSNYNKL